MPDKKKETIETYNKSARALAKKFDAIGARVTDIEHAFSYVSKENPFVFELGCGNGRDAKEIIKHTNHYLGIDLSEEMVELAQANVTRGKFLVADLETFKFPENIDIVFSFASLLHSNEKVVRLILKQAYESLNPNGIFFVSLKWGSGKEIINDEFGPRTYYYYTHEKIKKLAGSGFRVLNEDTQMLNGKKWFTIILQKK